MEDDSTSYIDPAYLRLRSKEVKPGDPRLKVGASVLAFQQVLKHIQNVPCLCTDVTMLHAFPLSSTQTQHLSSAVGAQHKLLVQREEHELYFDADIIAVKDDKRASDGRYCPYGSFMVSWS